MFSNPFRTKFSHYVFFQSSLPTATIVYNICSAYCKCQSIKNKIHTEKCTLSLFWQHIDFGAINDELVNTIINYVAHRSSAGFSLSL